MVLTEIKNKKILLLNDGRGVKNYGLHLGSIALVELFKKGGNQVESIPYWEFHRQIPSNATERQYRYLVRPITNFFMPDPIEIPWSFDQYPIAVKRWQESTNHFKKKIEKAILKADVVVFNAEGSCHSNNYAARKGLFLLYIASLLEKKTYFMNGSVTLKENQTELFSPIFKGISESIDSFLLRENLSVKSVQNVAPLIRASYFPDSTFFYYGHLAQINKSPTSKYFLVSGSMSKSYGMLSPEDLPLGKIVNMLASNFGKPIFVVKDVEDSYLTRFAAKFDYDVFSEDSQDKLFSLFQNASFLLSGRFHHMILATINGCPLIPMQTTSIKNNGFIDLLPDLEYSKMLLNPTDLLNSIEYIRDQAAIICNGKVQINAREALNEFSKKQYQQLMDGFRL